MYEAKPEKCEICKNSNFSEGCYKRPTKDVKQTSLYLDIKILN